MWKFLLKNDLVVVIKCNTSTNWLLVEVAATISDLAVYTFRNPSAMDIFRYDRSWKTNKFNSELFFPDNNCDGIYQWFHSSTPMSRIEWAKEQIDVRVLFATWLQMNFILWFPNEMTPIIWASDIARFITQFCIWCGFETVVHAHRIWFGEWLDSEDAKRYR